MTKLARQSIALGALAISFAATVFGAQSAPDSQRSANAGMFGAAIAGIGDIDRDGHADILVGAPELDDAKGSVWLFSGKDGSLLFHAKGEHRDDIDESRELSPADFAGDRLGASVASLGDIDGDQVPDFAIGVGSFVAERNGFDLYSGRTSKCIAHIGRVDPKGAIGRQIVSLGDLDGDGSPELLIGESRVGEYRALVVSSKSKKLVRALERPREHAKPIVVHEGDFDGPEEIGAIANAGDVDGDGANDILVGWPTIATEHSVVVLFSGRSGAVLRRIDGGPHEADFGTVLAGVGDFDGDGVVDFAAGYPRNAASDLDRVPMSMRVYSGKSGALLLEDHWDQLVAPPNVLDRRPESYNSGFANALCSAGDLERTGRSEVWMSFASRLPQGEVRLYSSKGLVRTIVGPRKEDEYFGKQIANAGDVDGDQVPDLLVSAYNDGCPSCPTSVYVFSGKDGKQLFRFTLADALKLADAQPKKDR